MQKAGGDISKSPLTDPAFFWHEVVVKNCDEFFSFPDSFQHAMNAVFALDSLVVRIYPFDSLTNESESAFKKRLSEEVTDYGLVRDVADAHRHPSLNRTGVQVSSLDQLALQSLGYGDARFGEGKFGGPPQLVIQTESDVRILSGVVLNCLKTLKEKFIDVKDKN
jgi:hypothetical protein